jgi:hypothetical protein
MSAGPSSRRWLFFLLSAVALTRIPFLTTGYGSDPDAWRVAHVSNVFYETGQYIPSRLPGYPVHEIASAPFVALGGAPLANSATLVVFLILLVVWHRFVLHHARHPRLLTVLLAFTPLLWANSAATIDYIWSLLFIFLSFNSGLKRRPVSAGIWIGLAIGSRPTNVIAAIGIMVLFLLVDRRWRQVSVFAISAALSTVIALSPLLLTYGFADWIRRTIEITSASRQPLSTVLPFFAYRTVYSLGPLATITASVLLIGYRSSLVRILKEKNLIVIASTGIVLACLGLFAVAPIERAYVIPAIPFLYLLLDRVSRQPALILFTLCVISFGFVNPDVIVHQGRVGTPGLNIDEGIVVKEWRLRQLHAYRRHALVRLAVTGKTIVMVGSPDEFILMNPDARIANGRQWRPDEDNVGQSLLDPDLTFVSTLPLADVRQKESDGYSIYCMDWATPLVTYWQGYDPRSAGIVILHF